ncbi:MAG: hypothetical protein ACRDRO_14700 [Pseudonocardiaceae bacterium]
MTDQFAAPQEAHEPAGAASPRVGLEVRALLWIRGRGGGRWSCGDRLIEVGDAGALTVETLVDGYQRAGIEVDANGPIGFLRSRRRRAQR